MKTLRNLTLATLTLTALTFGGLTSAKAALPNFNGYQFTLDLNDDRWQIQNYSVISPAHWVPYVQYNKTSPYRLYITSQTATGLFAGRLQATANNTFRNVTGALTQTFGQSFGGSANITFKTTDNALTFTGAVRPSPQYNSYFIAGTVVSSNYAGGSYFISGPNPFAGSGYYVVIPR